MPSCADCFFRQYLHETQILILERSPWINGLKYPRSSILRKNYRLPLGTYHLGLNFFRFPTSKDTKETERRQENENEKSDYDSFGNDFHAVIYFAFGLGREPSTVSMGGSRHRRWGGDFRWCTD